MTATPLNVVMLAMALAAAPPAAQAVLTDAQGDVGVLGPARDIHQVRLVSGQGRIRIEITTGADAVTKTSDPDTAGPEVVGASPQVQLTSSDPDVLEIDEYRSGEVQGRVVTVEIPYAKRGVTAGKTIRVYAAERGLPPEADTRFEPVLLRLE